MAGGMLVVSNRAELFDEASGRWFELPHPAKPGVFAGVVPLPTAAP